MRPCSLVPHLQSSFVNNAGNFDGGRVDTLTLAAWNNVIGACLTGAFLCSRAAYRIMKDQGLGGSIVFIAFPRYFLAV